MALYFKAGNPTMGDMHISEIDFVVRDEDEEIVDHELPYEVLQAIEVLRWYGHELESRE